jgi:hypothetical protein
MFLRFVKLFIQSFGAEYCVTVPLQKIRLLVGPFHDILHKTEQSVAT